MKKLRAAAVLTASATIVLGGCSQAGNERRVASRDDQVVREKVENASTEILDIMGTKGKVTESGAHPVQCSDYTAEDGVHRMRQSRSIYGTPDNDLEEAMESIRYQLPAKGWEIVKDGFDESQARLPQVLANSPDGHVSADVRLWTEAPQSKRSSMIEVTVVSDCFRSTSSREPSGQVTMDEQQATQRAEEVIHQAVDGMSPRPTLKRTGLRPVGPCLADEQSSGDRVQVRITYQLTDVPGGAAKKLVHQARDAWVKRGYEFQGPDGDWSRPFPSVSMRTASDDFWMTALTGVVDRATGEGLASISVTSPCYRAE